MIIYRDTKANTRGVPVWLDGADDLVERGDMQNASIKYYGIGAAHHVGNVKTWTDIGDGYSAALVGTPEPYLIARKIRWTPLAEAEDMHGRGWYVPHILRDDAVIIVPTYNDEYLPVFTEQQQRLIDIAKAARNALVAGDGVDISIAARWAAELLCAANHISEKTLLRLDLLDKALVVNALAAATDSKLAVV